jgi:hypothetical protein
MFNAMIIGACLMAKIDYWLYLIATQLLTVFDCNTIIDCIWLQRNYWLYLIATQLLTVFDCNTIIDCMRLQHNYWLYLIATQLFTIVWCALRRLKMFAGSNTSITLCCYINIVFFMYHNILSQWSTFYVMSC